MINHMQFMHNLDFYDVSQAMYLFSLEKNSCFMVYLCMFNFLFFHRKTSFIYPKKIKNKKGTSSPLLEKTG